MEISGPGTHYSCMPRAMPLSATRTLKLMKFLPEQTSVMLFSKMTLCIIKATSLKLLKCPLCNVRRRHRRNVFVKLHITGHIYLKYIFIRLLEVVEFKARWWIDQLLCQ